MVNILQAPKASQPYPWAKYARWLAEQGLEAEEIQTRLENGVEPAVTLAVGCEIDEAVPYPGLPSLEEIE
jgi:hypothetical protein